MLTIIVFVMTITTSRVTALVLAQMCLEASRKTATFYTQSAEVEKSEEMRKAAADAEMACAFYEQELDRLS